MKQPHCLASETATLPCQCGLLCVKPVLFCLAVCDCRCWAANYLTGRGVRLEEGSLILAGGLGLVSVSAQEEHWRTVIDIHAQVQDEEPSDKCDGLLSGLHSVSVRIGAA